MKVFMTFFCSVIACLTISHHAHAAANVVHHVKPIVAPLTVEASKNSKGEEVCRKGFTMQDNGTCCPVGTSNLLWPAACTPEGMNEHRVFNGKGNVIEYCPSDSMFIVSNKDGEWYSCAESDSTPFYSNTTSKGYDFCKQHGYGALLRINPWGQTGCIKEGDSRGDGCIEAGTCSMGK